MMFTHSMTETERLRWGSSPPGRKDLSLSARVVALSLGGGLAPFIQASIMRTARGLAEASGMCVRTCLTALRKLQAAGLLPGTQTVRQPLKTVTAALKAAMTCMGILRRDPAKEAVERLATTLYESGCRVAETLVRQADAAFDGQILELQCSSFAYDWLTGRQQHELRRAADQAGIQVHVVRGSAG